MGCNCCVQLHGICYIEKIEGTTDINVDTSDWSKIPDFLYLAKNNVMFGVYFGDIKPFFDGKNKEWDVDGWLKLKLPLSRTD